MTGSGWTPAEDVPTRDAAYIEKVWRQRGKPVLYKNPEKKGLMLRLPFSYEHPREWLTRYGCRRPDWVKQYKCWVTPKSWLKFLVDECLQRYGELYLIQPYREKEKCAPACWNAQGYDCSCSCAGMNHGIGSPEGRWFIVSDACAVQWHGKQLSCRLLTRRRPSETDSDHH